MTSTLTETAAAYVLAESPDAYVLTPTRLGIFTALRMAYAGDPAALRAIGRLEEAMGEGKVVVTAFDGVEGRCASVSRGQAVEHVFTATGCTCEGGRHPWHIHPMLFRLLLAERAIFDPAGLLAELCAATPPPADDEPPPPDDAHRPDWADEFPGL